MISTDGPTDSVQPVKFKGDKRKELIDHLTRELQTCKNDRAGMIKKCKEWVTQADSRRSRKDKRVRDSNVDMPLTRKRMNQNSARLRNPILQQDTIFVTKPRSGKAEDMARELERAIDYMSDQIDYGALMDDWIEQFQTFPCGIVKTPFVTESEKVVR